MTYLKTRIDHREIRYFLNSQAFADGFRTTLAILIPSLTGFYFGQFETGMTLSLGALCVSLTDAPGPILNKRNGMLLAALGLFLVSLLTSTARLSTIWMAAELGAVAFFFSMFNAYGSRAAGVGNAAILIMILTMDKTPTGGPLVHAALVTAGGIWYFCLSFFFSVVSPFRPSQRVLGDCIREMARFLAVKARFYDPSTELQDDYRRMISRQVVVHEKQDAVRELLFKTRQIVQETSLPGRRLVLLFVETVDFFEDITHIYYDYAQLRDRFANTGILEKIAGRIHAIALALDAFGVAVQSNRPYHAAIDFEDSLVKLKEEIDALPRMATESHLVLRKILVNLRRLVQRYRELEQYFKEEAPSTGNRLDHGRFVTHQPLDPRIFSDNLTLQSGVFRHSLRVAIACLAGFGLTRMINYGQHSYWVLLTIAFILKPAFSLTRERNVQRIIGTVSGGLIGIGILLFVPIRRIQFAFMVLFMLLTYSFMRINYLVMVIFTTPFVLLLFSFLGMPFREVAVERLFDTVLGCAIAFGCSVLLFPAWESAQLGSHLQNLLDANRRYLKLVADGLEGQPIKLLPYKLARKEIYVQTANLSAAFQRMLNEPKESQRDAQQLQQFIVLQHILFSNIASIASELMTKEPRVHTAGLRQAGHKAFHVLEKSAERLGLAPLERNFTTNDTAGIADTEPLLEGQLQFICQLCQDMDKVLALRYPSNQRNASS
jgi:uncharacterized membrane protein (TIGR01666 family)